MDHLADSAGSYTVTTRELAAGPSVYEVEGYDPPLNVPAVLARK